MEQVKVKHSQNITNNSGNHLVCGGQLIIRRTNEPAKNGQLAYNLSEENKYFVCHLGNVCINSRLAIPFIISQIEEVVDINQPSWNKKLQEFGQALNADKVYNHLVLASADMLSKKHLEVICEGTLKDGDDVWVECNDWFEENNLPFIAMGSAANPDYSVEVKIKNGKVVLHPVENTVKVDMEVVNHIIKYCEDKAVYDKLGAYGDFYYKLKQLTKTK